MDKFEYKVFHYDRIYVKQSSGTTTEEIMEKCRVEIEKIINQFGEEGWELVSTECHGNFLYYCTLFFKRKKIDKSINIASK